MSRRASADRIFTVRAIQELVAEAAYQRAMVSLREAEESMRGIETEQKLTFIESSCAVQREDRVDWILTDARRELLKRRREQLVPELNHRVRAVDALENELHATRQGRERSEALLERLRIRLQREQDRLFQAESDDRFAARRRWDTFQTRLETS